MSTVHGGIKIKPNVHRAGNQKPSQVEIIDGIRDLPEFKNLDDRHWKSIYMMWDISAKTGRPATMAAISKATHIAQSTLKNWRCREDYLRASELVKLEVLNEWTPVILNKALQMAASGDKQMIKLFVEGFILPEKKKEEETIVSPEVHISWGDPDPIPVIDAESTEKEE